MNWDSWFNSFSEAYKIIIERILLYIPNLIGGILVFWLGLLVAGWLYKLTKKSLALVQFNKLVDSSGFGKFLAQGEIQTKVEEIIALLVKWTVIVVVLISSLNILGLKGISRILEEALAYVPNVISASLVLAIGLILAGVVESLLKGVLVPLDVRTGRLSAKVGSYFVAVLAVMAALQELGIAQDLIQAMYFGLISALALAFGLAVGLGSKDLVKRLLEEWYDDLTKKRKK